MAVTPGKKSPKKTPKQKSPGDLELMETTVTEKAITPKSPTNGLEKKSDSKKKKSLKRKLDNDDYEENAEEVNNSVIIEEDLNASQKDSSKKQKKKKQRVDNEEEDKSSDKKSGLSSGDEKEDEEGGNIPSECKLFVTSLGLEGMSKRELRDYFKSHGYSLAITIKRIKSRHAFVGFATEKEAKKATDSLDKIDCRGFPLSIEAKDLMLNSLRLIKPPKSSHLINKEGTADCILYVSPLTPGVTKQKLMDSLIGVVRVDIKSRKKNWARLECLNSTVAKEIHRSHQGKVVEGTALRLETTEEFRKRITVEEVERNKKSQKQRNLEKKMEKKQKLTKQSEKKSKPEPKESADKESDESDSEEEVDGGGDDDDDDEAADVNVVDDDSEEEEVKPKPKKAKVAGKR